MDRKAWIILIFCAALLGVNFYFQPSQEQRQAIAEQKKVAETPVQQGVSSVLDAAVPSVIQTPDKVGELVVPPTPGSGVKETWTLTSFKKKGDKNEPLVKFTFSNVGGSLETVELLNQPVDSKRCPERNIQINSDATTGIGTLMFSVNGRGLPVSDTGIYERMPSSTDTKLILRGKAANDLLVMKEYTLSPQVDEQGQEVVGAPYLLKLKITLMNPSENSVKVSDMGLFAGYASPINKDEGNIYVHYFWKDDGSFEQKTPSTFSGGFLSSAQSFDWQESPKLEYAGVMGQFFVSIVIPETNAKGNHILATPHEAILPDGTEQAKGNELVVALPALDFAGKGVQELNYDIFTGPKLNQMLGEMPFGLDSVMGYGWLTLLSEPMNWLLNLFHTWFGNWGVAIICMTLVVRGVIWPLHKKSYMAMKRMSLLQPKMQELKEKYPNDPQKVNMEMMSMYQKYGVNPIGGCLPMLIQIPIFFAFYRVLQSSAELRGEPFIFWIKDLARPDTIYDFHLPFSVPFFGTEVPLNILPFIMGATMILQMSLTPKAGDKTQRMIMNLMPIMFFAFCYNFASALALYWTTQNIISIGQTYLIRRLPEPALGANKKKPGFFQRLMEQQRVMMEQQQAAQRKNKGNGNNPPMRNVTPKK